jgi:ketosteroid isomerase-like protein
MSHSCVEEVSMIRFIALTICLIFLVSCAGEAGIDQMRSQAVKETELVQKALDLKKEKEKLMETDRLFSKTSEEKGFGGAFALFTAEDARIFQNKLMPIIGKDEIVKFLTDNVKATIAWEPYFVEMSASGDLGYTLGKSQSTVTGASGKKTVSYGHYVTIWKKQPDGNWKLVFDTGIETPE